MPRCGARGAEICRGHKRAPPPRSRERAASSSRGPARPSGGGLRSRTPVKTILDGQGSSWRTFSLDVIPRQHSCRCAYGGHNPQPIVHVSVGRVHSYAPTSASEVETPRRTILGIHHTADLVPYSAALCTSCNSHSKSREIVARASLPRDMVNLSRTASLDCTASSEPTSAPCRCTLPRADDAHTIPISLDSLVPLA